MEAGQILNLGLWCKLERWLRPSNVKSDTVCPPSARLQKLNGQVFEVCKPAGSGIPSLEIVFFHGLQLEPSSQPHVTTWLSGDKSELWLNWLQDENPDIRVLVVSYDSSSKRTEKAGRTDMYITCENLLHDLTDRAAHVGQDGCPVILVGHCLGGLVLKEVCLKANLILSLRDPFCSRQVENVLNFLENMKGVFFYATPHHGAIIVGHLNVSSSKEFQKGSLLQDLVPLNEQVQRRNEDFRMLRQKWKWKAAGVGEGREVTTENFTGFVLSVPEASSRSEIDQMGYYTVTTADHFSICRPTDKKCASFTQLQNFIKESQEEYQRSIAPPFSVPKNIVGMHGVLEEVKDLLISTKRLGVIGMGGIGKTTLVKSLYENIKRGFQYACLVDDVKGKLGDQKDTFHLQNLIINGLTRKGMRKVDVGFDWKRLKNQKILIILDDVEKRSHVKIMTDEDEFSEESRVIVTSRNRMFLGSEGFEFHDMKLLPDPESYRLLCSHAFKKEEAPDDFQGHVREVLKQCGNLPLAIEVVGSSLFGRELIHWTEMTETIAGAYSPDGTYPDELWSILRRSFDSLDVREQEMFLDIATCFYGMRIWDVKRAWKFMSRRSAESGWQNLVDRCLAKQDNVDRISMHELLRDLGKSIACPFQAGISTMHTRVEDVQLANKLYSAERSSIQVLKLYNREWRKDRERFDMRVLHEFHNLRALWLHESGACDELPEPLPGGCIFPVHLTFVELGDAGSVAVNGICRVQGLRCLILYGGVEELPSSLGHLVHLEYLEMAGCGIKVIPGEIAQLRSLQHLEIFGCMELTIIPAEISQLRRLHQFRIGCCDSLESLPSSITKLKALQAFEVYDCAALCFSFSWLCELRALKNASKFKVDCLVNGFYVLRVTDNGRQWVHVVTSAEAPKINEKEWLSMESISDVGIHVHLWDCGEETRFYVGGFENVSRALSERKQLRMGQLVIFDIPGDIDRVSTLSTEDFQGLQSLEILSCRQVAKLPVFGPQLSALRYLCIYNLPLLETLPELWQLQGLKVLQLVDLPRLQRLPESVGHLQVLKTLRLNKLSRLSGLPESVGHLKALVVMELVGLPRLYTLPISLGALTALRDLKIYQSACLRSPWGTACNWGLRSLETLTLDSGHLDDKQQEYNSTLDTYHPNDDCWEYCSDCFRFHKYPLAAKSTEDSSYFPKLQREYKMVAVEVLEAVVRGQFPKLNYVALTLEMRDVELFSDLSGGHLALQRMEIRDSPGFIKLSESCGQLGWLKVLKIVECKTLVELPKWMGQLFALEQLEIVNCYGLVRLPESCWELGSLKVLKIEECNALLELPEWVGQLPALKHLEIVGCKKLTKLKGSVGQVRTLERFIFSRAMALDTLAHERLAGLLHSIVAVELALKRLTIKRFDSDDEWLSGSFGQLPFLEHLDLVDCWRTRSLSQSVWQICRLKSLTIERCRILEELPLSIGEPGLLKRVSIKDCFAVANFGNCLGWLGALEDLEVDRTILAKLAGYLGQLGSLKRLTIESFRSDRAELPESLGQLGVLEELAIRNQDKRLKYRLSVEEWRSYQERVIRKLPESIGQLSVLKRLEISDFEEITQLPVTIGELSRLEEIVVRHCPKLEAWRPSSQHLQHVEELELTYEYRERHAPKLTYGIVLEDLDENPVRNDVLKTILQRRHLLTMVEEEKSLLEAAVMIDKANNYS